MIDLDGMISIPYLKKTIFTGSYYQMNYMLRKESTEEGDKIRVIAWPGPYIYSVTEEEKKIFRDFPFSANGIKEAIAWLNAHYEEVYREDREES